MTEVAGLLSFENLNNTDVIWSSTEAEDMEVALRSIVEATSWMGLVDVRVDVFITLLAKIPALRAGLCCALGYPLHGHP